MNTMIYQVYKKKKEYKYKPKKLFLKAYNYKPWVKSVESTDDEESTDVPLMPSVLVES